MSLILVTTIFSQGFLIQDAYSGIEDTTEPETTIDSAVDGNSIVIPDGGSTISDSMTFTFSGTDDSGVASFECDVDHGGFTLCSSPLDLTSLSDGFHNFMVRAIDNSGNTDSTPASFSWTSSPVSAGDILVIDTVGGTSDRGALFSVDPSGNRTIISDFGNAAQGALGDNPRGVAINASGEILVTDRSAGTSSLGALFTVDPSSGNRIIISDFGNTAQGATGEAPFGLAINASGEILVADVSAGTSSRGALFSVDPSSGNRIIISDFGNATQGQLGSQPRGVAINASGEILVIDEDAGTGRGALFSVDPSGNRTIISDFGNAAQGALGFDPNGVAIFPDIPEPISEFGFGPSFLANGTNFLDEPDKPDLRLQEFSLASWFKTSHNAVGANAMIVNKGGLGAGENRNYGLFLNWGERLKGGFESTTGTNKFVISPNSYNDGNPHYAVVTYDRSILKLYVDGSIIGTLSTSAIPDAGSSLPVRIAANSAAENEFFNGSIDEVRIWNRTLTDQEVSDQYNSAIFDTAGQVLYLDMSEPSVNNPPVADAGPDQTAIDGSLVTLDGTGSSDPDGDSITYSWTQTSGTNVTLSNATIANPTFVAPSTTEEIMLSFSLVVNDGLLDSLPDSVVITVSPIISGISCLQEPATIVGTEGNDVIVGTEGDDVIHGLGGNDIIRGLGGDDFICGGTGDDELIGGQGNDMMAGGTGNDGMYGVQGSDVMYGNPGNDTIFGGGENDIVYGGLGDDIINGGNGNDRLFVGPDDDTLFGGDGIDVLHGGTGLNVCSTGETLVDCI